MVENGKGKKGEEKLPPGKSQLILASPVHVGSDSLAPSGQSLFKPSLVS